jgi:RimJ/RimL family protein N-acetyltransferase
MTSISSPSASVLVGSGTDPVAIELELTGTLEAAVVGKRGNVLVQYPRRRQAAVEVIVAVSRAGPIVVGSGSLHLVHVRRAKIDDAEAMALIMAAVAKEGLIGAEPPVDVEARARRFREAIEAQGPGASWVLEDAGRVVGNADVHERAPGVLYLGMAILPAARRRGGGRAFLAVILEHARACGAHKLELEVWLDNARAIALYASAGFEVEGLRRNHYRRRDGSLRSGLLMARLLGDD